MKTTKSFVVALLTLALFVFEPFLSQIQAESGSESAVVLQIKGAAYYSKDKEVWLPLKIKTRLQPGMLIKTAPESNAILQWEKSGGVLRANADTILRLVKSTSRDTPLEIITETDIELIQGSVTGSEKKSSALSHFKISLPTGFALFEGSQYYIDANGSVSVFRGSASLNFAENHTKISAGQNYPSTSENLLFRPVPKLEDLPGDTTSAVAKVTAPVERRVSPTHGDNGVGNGQDPQPPGNPPVNDGPGTGPGNPGNGH